MAAPTVKVMSAAIQRRCKGKIPLLEILDALDEKQKEIHGHYEWPWTVGEYLIPIQGTYNTGTISVTDGSTIVTGTGTAWDPAWRYKRIYLGAQNVDFLVDTVDSPTQITLKNPVNFGENLTDQTYMIFQDIYALPDDCETILLIVNPLFRYRLDYVPTYTLQWQNVFSRVFFSQFQTGFCDGAYDDDTSARTIQFAPPPGGVAEYKLIYRRRPPTLDGLGDKTILPETYYRGLELLAEYQVRFENQLPGWSECKREGYQIIQSMRRKYTAAPMYDTYSLYWQYPRYEQSSIYAGGLFVGPTSA